MAIEIMLPKQGWTMEEAVFVEWLVADGASVAVGQPIFSVETDKAIQEIESLDGGILRILPGGPVKGDTIRVGQVIGSLLQSGEAAPQPVAPAAASKPRSRQEDWPKAAVSANSSQASLRASAPVPVAGGRTVTPRAAKRALREGVDLRAVVGSGRGGRIRESDVASAKSKNADLSASEPVSEAPFPAAVPSSLGPSGREMAITTLRRKIADRMHQSKTLTAPVTLTTKANAGSLANLRAQYKAALAASSDPVPSYSDMIMKLVAAALKEHPALNARWEETRIVQVEAINIGLAVDTDAGLMVPVVREVPSLSLRQLAARTVDLIGRARQRRVSVDELTGGTFTVTNLGAANVDAFTPIINHPECAVLGMGRIVREPAVVEGKIVVRDAIWLSLTFDHRVVDGAPAARFLDTLRKNVEKPNAILNP